MSASEEVIEKNEVSEKSVILKHLEQMVDALVDDFIQQLNHYSDTEKEKKKAAVLEEIQSPFDKMFGLDTDDYRKIMLFRGSYALEEEDSSNCIPITSLNDILSATRLALNNNNGCDDFQSFSESLHIALFKYRRDYLQHITTYKNCILLEIIVNCYNWLETDNRYFDAKFTVPVPFRYVFDKEAVKLLFLQYLSDPVTWAQDVSEDMYDLDSIESFSIVGFTLSLWENGRSELDNAFHYGQSGEELKSIVSFQKDREVIHYSEDKLGTNLSSRRLMTSSVKQTDRLRIYYLLKLYAFHHTAAQYAAFAQNLAETQDDRDIWSAVVEHMEHAYWQECNSYCEDYEETPIRYVGGGARRDSFMVLLGKCFQSEVKPGQTYINIESAKEFKEFCVENSDAEGEWIKTIL